MRLAVSNGITYMKDMASGLRAMPMGCRRQKMTATS